MTLSRLLYAGTVIAVMVIVVLVFDIVLFSAQHANDDEETLRPKTNAQFYVVKEGDVLSGIEQKTGVEIEQMERLNRRLDPENLLPGQRIRLRPPTQRELARRRALARSRPPKRRTYVLKKGDVLSEVARKNGVDLIRILDLNRGIKSPDQVYPGKRIRLR